MGWQERFSYLGDGLVAAAEFVDVAALSVSPRERGKEGGRVETVMACPLANIFSKTALKNDVRLPPPRPPPKMVVWRGGGGGEDYNSN